MASTEFFGAYYDDDVPGRTSREFELRNRNRRARRRQGRQWSSLWYQSRVAEQHWRRRRTGVGVDEASVYVGGTWGRIELGDFDGAADTLAIYAPVVGIEQIDGDAYDFLAVEQDGFSYGSQPIGSMVQAPDSGDSTKIMYLTPRFAGIQAGISYATKMAEVSGRGRLQDRRRLQGLLGSGRELHG